MYLVVQFWDKILEWICTTILLLKLGKGPGKPFILVQFWAKERKGYERIYPIPTGKEQFCGQKYFPWQAISWSSVLGKGYKEQSRRLKHTKKHCKIILSHIRDQKRTVWNDNYFLFDLVGPTSDFYSKFEVMTSLLSGCKWGLQKVRTHCAKR